MHNIPGETTRHGSMSFSEGQSRAFVDCWFTLAALDSDPDQQKHVRNVIRKAGGRIFDAGRLNLVTNTSGAYAVCPFGFPPQARKEAMRHADFKKGNMSNHLLSPITKQSGQGAAAPSLTCICLFFYSLQPVKGCAAACVTCSEAVMRSSQHLL